MDLPDNCILSRPSEWAKKGKFPFQTGKISIWLIAFQIQPGQMVPIGFILQVEPAFSHNKTARQKLVQDRLKYLRPKPFIPAAAFSVVVSAVEENRHLIQPVKTVQGIPGMSQDFYRRTASLSWAFLVKSGLQTPWVEPFRCSTFTPFASILTVPDFSEALQA